MSKRPGLLPRPIAIFDQDEKRLPIADQYLLTLRTAADVRKLLKGIPKQRREISSWRNVEKHLAGASAADLSVAVQLALQIERVPYTIKAK